MSYIQVFGDITTFSGDAIINSVGVKTTEYGTICASILQAAQSDDLEKIFEDINDVYNVGDFFVTDGYNLPSRFILHLIPPHVKDDPCMFQYAECIKRALNECRIRGLYNIAIPKIGTGANDYDEEKASDLIERMCFSYCKLYPDMDITFFKPTDEMRGKVGELEYYSGRRYHDKETLRKFTKGSTELLEWMDFKGFEKFDRAYFGLSNYSKGHANISIESDEPLTIGEYVEQYIDLRCQIDSSYPKEEFVYKRIYKFLGYGSSGKDKAVKNGYDTYYHLKERKEVTDKKLIYKIALALRMNFVEMKKMLSYYGFCLSHKGINSLDDHIEEVFEQKHYGIVEIEIFLESIGIENLLFKK